tara:strand:- start:43 stop:276 length:234 start_codon:yes stop_codon:yes gene_type:complete
MIIINEIINIYNRLIGKDYLLGGLAPEEALEVRTLQDKFPISDKVESVEKLAEKPRIKDSTSRHQHPYLGQNFDTTA